jgi:hypothetical protein
MYHGNAFPKALITLNTWIYKENILWGTINLALGYESSQLTEAVQGMTDAMDGLIERASGVFFFAHYFQRPYSLNLEEK